MAKKDDTLDVWKYRYPSAGVSWKFTGDMAYCQRFTGEANVMLYNLKNRMNLSASLDPAYRLKSLQDIRHYNDGTVIIVKSVYGQDFIKINAGKGLLPTCSITLYDVPESVQPMHWYLDGIQGGEVEGIDYIKTYYSFSVNNCPNCSSLDFTVCDSEELPKTYGWTAPQTCKPFTYQSENDRGEPILLYQGNPVPYHMGYDWTDPPILPDPMNHCIYGSCQAEIIKFGHDENGSYFLWKIYTEWSSLGPTYATFYRSGLGYLLLRAFIKLGGQELCASASSIIKVDCCLKDSAFRPVIIFWEKCDLGWQICPAPEVTSMTDIDFFWTYGGWNVMGLWLRAPTSQQSSCGPYVWTLSGMGELLVGEAETGVATYRLRATDYQNRDCHDQVKIGVTDRCGKDDSILFESCCNTEPAPVEIGYSTIWMSCGQSQDHSVSGGCSPYSWSLSAGGGTLVDNQDGTATYTAPDTNPDCSLNPTISVTDCCGDSDEVKHNVNCYFGAEAAQRYCFNTICIDTCSDHFHGIFCREEYDCDWYYTDWYYYDGISRAECWCYSPSTQLGCPISDWESPNCGGLSVGCMGQDCNTVKDLRTQAMKDAGCCPLDPITYLPY